MRIGSKEFATSGHTYIMGILNVTPDSFSDGGKWNDRERALQHAEEMLEQGADIIDIGGESTRPGHTAVPEEEEIRRVVPVIEAVKARFDVPVSLDTCKSAVAQAGIEAGADLVNDIWGLRWDEKMAYVISKNKIPCCLMHNRKKADYADFMQDVKADLQETLNLAARAGIPRDRIILDPGLGFAKTPAQNLEAVRRLGELRELGSPLLLGASRKSFIGLALNLPPEDRLEGTLVTTVFAVTQGCTFVRVHDVRENLRAVRMAEAILKGGTD